MRTTSLALLAALALAGCEKEKAVWKVDPSWLADSSWDDGAAVVSVFRGRWKKYGQWRDAEVRDYLIREHLDRKDLTKRDEPGANTTPVIKANRHVRFSTGTYEYRLMSSLFFSRETGGLVKAVASSQDGCGLTFQRYGLGEHSWDSYWPGEGRGAMPAAKVGMRFYADEIPYLARLMENGASLSEMPPLVSNRVQTPRPAERRIRREGDTVEVLAEDGTVHARFNYDADGFLLRWTVEGEQEFERVSKRRLYYWQHTAPGDEKLLEGE